jgi:hypothetical protein
MSSTRTPLRTTTELFEATRKGFPKYKVTATKLISGIDDDHYRVITVEYAVSDNTAVYIVTEFTITNRKRIFGIARKPRIKDRFIDRVHNRKAADYLLAEFF